MPRNRSQPIEEFSKQIMELKTIMQKKNYYEFFSDSQKPFDLTIKDVADWMQTEVSGRLLLPPIQRSVVWNNEQIINYWDSLLRGYPPGLMMVHRASNKGRDADGETVETEKDDSQLFDGQQRMTAILLGFGMGQLKNIRKLWVDLGSKPNRNSGLKFQLRINSIGQPFGYRPEAPNQKLELKKRQKNWERWNPKGSIKNPKEIFKEINGKDLVDAICAVSLKEILVSLCKHGRINTILNLKSKLDVNEQRVDEFLNALESALNSKIIFQNVSTEIVADQNEYIRFFTRLGQGGTRLSDDELTYSIIKYNYPEIHDRMKEIMRGDSGRIAGEVDLVMSALRVAKTLMPWEQAKEWEVIGRPSPAFVSQLKDRKEVETKFLELIPKVQENGSLKTALTNIRSAIKYDEHTHSKGLPAMLLAQLPRELVDVLILLSYKRSTLKPWDDQKETLRTFVLHWLFFVRDDAKAAWLVFQQVYKRVSHNLYSNAEWAFNQESIRYLIKEFEREGIAYTIPSSSEIPKLETEVKKKFHLLCPWEERFIIVDRENQRKPGESIRMISTNPKLIKRALMWLQRAYLAKKFPNYDPTSDRDEDLPVDLDHLIPHDVFGFNWNGCYSRLDKDITEDKDTFDNFWRFRHTVGNSLGNYRWLSSSENRGRQKSLLIPLENNEDLLINHNDWNVLIRAQENGQKWKKDHIMKFQHLIDLRTLKLFKALLTETGIENVM